MSAALGILAKLQEGRCIKTFNEIYRAVLMDLSASLSALGGGGGLARAYSALLHHAYPLLLFSLCEQDGRKGRIVYLPSSEERCTSGGSEWCTLEAALKVGCPYRVPRGSAAHCLMQHAPALLRFANPECAAVCHPMASLSPPWV